MEKNDFKQWHYIGNSLYSYHNKIGQEQIPIDRKLSIMDILKNLYNFIDSFLETLNIENSLELKASIDSNYNTNTTKLYFYLYFSEERQKELISHNIFEKFDDFYFKFFEKFNELIKNISSNKKLEVSLQLLDSQDELEEFDYANLISKERILIELPIFFLSSKMETNNKTSRKYITK